MRKTLKHKAWLAIPLLVLVLVVAGCNSKTTTVTPTPTPTITVTPTPTPTPTPTITVTPTPTPSTFEIHVLGFAFVPDVITVPVGATVTWINLDDVPYFIDSDTNLFKSDAIMSGSSFSYTFTQPGTFDFHIDESADQCATEDAKGRVIVE